FAGNGALVFMIAILVAAAMPTQAILAQSNAVPLRSFPDFRSAAGLNLTNGTVQPYRGVPGQTFTFRVNLTTAGNGTPDAFNVTLNLTAVDGFAFTPTSYRMAYGPGPISSPHTRNGTWARERVMRAGRPAAKPETPPTKPERKEATERTKAGKAAAFTCTNCGADVSESDQKCPSCGAAFED